MKHTDAIQAYLAEVGKLYKRPDATEHTYRPAFKSLLDAFSPTGVDAINEPKRERVGAPDFIVTKGKGRVPLGYVETKDIGKSLAKEARSEQLKRYRGGFHNLILTDYLEFWWYVGGEDKPRRKVKLATTGDNKKLKERKKGAAELAEFFELFFQEQAPRATRAKDLAQRMATIARIVHELIENIFKGEKETGHLHGQLEAFRRVLVPALKEAEFADMYAQTMAYGLFAARCQKPESSYFDREHAAGLLPRTNPFLRKLFAEIAGPELDRRLDWAVDELVYVLKCADMGAVLEDFGRHKGKTDPVIHFYETFLAAYDPKMREARGVYYTPEPVVDYIVRSVDELLKTRFGKKAGLADESVLVLDPACGTGTFLQRVIELVYERFKGNKGMWSEYVREKLLPRLFGFELLMAPYTMAHMKLAIELGRTGYDFKADERLNIFLTNTLEEAAKKSERMPFANYIADEANEAAKVKRDKPIMVVIGNPPYSGHSANASWREVVDENGKKRKKKTWIGRLLDDYYQVDGKPLGEKNPKWLQDDYVKFLRFAQWRIQETGEGIVGFITNHGYLDNPTFRGMRQQLLTAFDEIHVLDLHGNAKKKEACPDGSPDKNVFDIMQGVAIALMVKDGKDGGVRHANLWGKREAKYKRLASESASTTKWKKLKPQPEYYLFVPRDTKRLAEYERGWKVTEAMPVNVLGFQTHRDGFAVVFERDEMQRRISEMRKEELSDTEFRQKYDLKDNRDWQLARAREDLRKDQNWKVPIVDCLYRPFDRRACYFDEIAMDYPRRELREHVAGKSNLCLLSSRQQGTVGYRHCWVAKQPANDCVVSTRSREANQVFPLYCYPTEQSKGTLFDKEHWLPGKNGRRPNLAPEFVEEFGKKLKLKFVTDGRGDVKKSFGPEDIFNYIYAVFHSPTYRSRYAELLKIDFPRVPLTSSKPLFRKLAALGGKLVKLHLLETPELDDSEFRPHYPVEGDNAVEKPRYDEKQKRVYVNATQYFEPVEPETWEFQVGGYQVCHKWLKDRAKASRTLSYDDLEHYAKTCAALRETIKLMADVDKAIPDWPME